MNDIKIGNIFKPFVNWANAQGNWPDIVFSTRVRFARNIYGFSFPQRASVEKLEEVRGIIIEAIKKIKNFSTRAHFINMRNLNSSEKMFLIERHHISHNLANESRNGAVAIAGDEMLSIMVNEEDHLRIQGIVSGLSVDKAFEQVSSVDDELGRILDYAYNRKFGFLTACPTNVGTGFRVSCLVHLPALTKTGQIQKVLENLSHISITARGIYGEGTYVLGDFYQISNATCLGHSEQEFSKNLNSVINNLIKREIRAREELLSKDLKVKTEDSIYRAWGVLKNSRMISYEEFMQNSSMVRMGIAMGYSIPIDFVTLNQLLILMQPVHLQVLTGKKLEPFERDIERSQYIRKILK